MGFGRQGLAQHQLDAAEIRIGLGVAERHVDALLHNASGAREKR
jgi:hypothetical protein